MFSDDNDSLNESDCHDSEDAANLASPDEDTAGNNDESVGLDRRPVTHWGSRKGIILSASVCDSRGRRKDVHEWGSLLKIVIDLRIPNDVPREHLSIAFSIKDLHGTDLIVSTTHDHEPLVLPEKSQFQVSFNLINPLVSGKYLLVAAVENRQHQDIHYYEYFEGAHYFSSFSEERFFGLFQPFIEKGVKVPACRIM